MYYNYIYLDPRKSGRYCYNDFCLLCEPFYVGKGKKGRWKEFNHGRTKIFKNKINKIKSIGFEPIMVKLFENLDEGESFELEKKLIREIGRVDLKTGTLVNMTDGGEGSSGHVVSEETRNKKSKKLKGHILSKETKNKISNSKMGKFPSEETRKKLSEKRRGIKFSEEHKKNLSESKKGKNNPFFGKHLLDDHRLKISESEKGENNGNNILISQDVIQIKLLLKEGKLIQKEIADIFEISQITVSRIKTGNSWSHIKI